MQGYFVFCFLICLFSHKTQPHDGQAQTEALQGEQKCSEKARNSLDNLQRKSSRPSLIISQSRIVDWQPLRHPQCNSLVFEER